MAYILNMRSYNSLLEQWAGLACLLSSRPRRENHVPNERANPLDNHAVFVSFTSVRYEASNTHGAHVFPRSMKPAIGRFGKLVISAGTKI